MDALRRQAELSRQNEPGCLRFEVFVDEAAPWRIFIHEVYATKEDYEEVHRGTAYYAEWRSVLDRAKSEDPLIVRLVPDRLEL